MEITFKLIDSSRDEIPYDLLLLADPSRDLIDDYIQRGYCYVAVSDNEIIGEFVLIPTHPKTFEIVNISVREEHQGKGIGKKLILKALEEVQILGGKSVEIGTGNSSIQQLGLYQKCGFRISGIEHDFFVRNYEEEIYENGIQCRDMIRLRKDI